VTDVELVSRAKAGDSSAFGELVDRHRTAVYRAALAALGSHAEAEDAAQEAFLMAWRRLHGFRGDASFKTWLVTIGWHQAINRRRSLTRILKRQFQPAARFDDEVDALGDSIADPAPSPEAETAGRQARGVVAKEIRRLSPKLRDALLLASSGEYSYQDMSTMLKAPVGTIKWRVSEARRLVRQRLSETGFSALGPTR
jgi:RNA polymerase sigma-70 factor (ECF subfamily)